MAFESRVRTDANLMWLQAKAYEGGWLPVELAVGKTVILLHPPLHSVGVSLERGCQQNDSLANG